MTEAERRLDRSTTCAASSHPLRAPIVVCGLGYLYNKEDLIEKIYYVAERLPGLRDGIASKAKEEPSNKCPYSNFVVQANVVRKQLVELLRKTEFDPAH